MGPPPVVSISSNVAPRSPFSFVGRAGRAARALITAASALALAVGALTVAPAPAHAADPITTQEYFSYYHLDSARQKGYTGKGVTIALIDGPSTPMLPNSRAPMSLTRAHAPSRRVQATYSMQQAWQPFWSRLILG